MKTYVAYIWQNVPFCDSQYLCERRVYFSRTEFHQIEPGNFLHIKKTDFFYRTMTSRNQMTVTTSVPDGVFQLSMTLRLTSGEKSQKWSYTIDELHQFLGYILFIRCRFWSCMHLFSFFRSMQNQCFSLSSSLSLLCVSVNTYDIKMHFNRKQNAFNTWIAHETEKIK